MLLVKFIFIFLTSLLFFEIFFSKAVLAQKYPQPAHAKTAYGYKLDLLTFEDFQRLTASEQKAYLIEVRHLVDDLTNEDSVSLWQRLFINSAEAISVDGISQDYMQQSSQKNEELDRLDRLISSMRGKKAVDKFYKTETQKDSLEQISKSYVQRMNTVRPQLTENFELALYRKLFNEFRRDFPGPSAELQPLSDEQSSSLASKAVQQKPARRRPAAQTKPAALGTAGSTSTAAAAPTTTSSDNKDYNPSCIYAGFVIHGGKCQPNKSLPDNLKIDEIKTLPFQCDDPKQIPCNPLLYGLKFKCVHPEPGTLDTCDQKPLCISRSRTASKECTRLSNTTEQLDLILKIWRNPKNRNIYDRFIIELTSFMF